MAELGLPLEELVRRGAREILQRAIAAEVHEFLEQFRSETMRGGCRAEVSNGYLSECEILTTVGPVALQIPKVRDRSGFGVKFNSTLAPPYVRRSAPVAAELPWLYRRKGSPVETRGRPCERCREAAKGRSAPTLDRLKAQWSEYYQG